MAEIRIELIAVGDELLIGMTRDTNSHWIAGRLAAAGMRLQRLVWAADEAQELRAQIEAAWQRADVVIVTGGLGPTPDDVTRPVIADFFGASLRLREDLAAGIRERYARRGLEPAPGWEAMATFPTGAVPIPNGHGAAPGIHCSRDARELFALPGVPAEMMAMLDDYVLPRVQRRRTGAYRYCIFRTVGIGESHLAKLIGDPKRFAPVALAFLPNIDNGVTLRLSCFGEDGAQARAALSQAEEAVAEAVKPYVYARDESPIEAVILAQMRDRGLKLAVAESCTGGLICSRLVAIPGSSDVLERGFVTYSNRAKVEQLGVSEKTLDRCGAISEETAREMAAGARQKSGADIGLAVTGIAGPSGGTPDKPVGLVYAAVADKNGFEALRHQFAGDRDDNRRRSALAALALLYHRIVG